jgi:hypothetical protein
MYVILQPHSNTNNSDKYAIVKFDDWVSYTNGELVGMPIVSRHDTWEEADQNVARWQLSHS